MHTVPIHTQNGGFVFIPLFSFHVTDQFKSPVPFNYPLKEASADQLIRTGTGARICTFLLSLLSAAVPNVDWVSKYSL